MIRIRLQQVTARLRVAATVNPVMPKHGPGSVGFSGPQSARPPLPGAGDLAFAQELGFLQVFRELGVSG